MSRRLTQKNEQGNWWVKGLPWEKLGAGTPITKKTQEKLYGCLYKLMKYEETGLSPDEVERLNTFDGSQAVKATIALQKERRKHRWIPVEEKLPDGGYILMSFENFPIPLIGRYEEDGEGGAFYVGDYEESCISQELMVNAWRPVPEPYLPES